MASATPAMKKGMVLFEWTASGGSWVPGGLNSPGFVAKYDVAGNPIWIRAAGNKGLAVTADPGGTNYVGGLFRGIVAGSPGSTPANFGNLTLNGFGGFVAKYNTAGDAVWVKKIGEQVNAVAADAHGNIYATGSFNGTETIDGNTITASATGPDIFVARFNQLGQCLWLRHAGSSAINGHVDKGLAISFDSSGNVYVAGEAGDNAVFGSINLSGRGGFLAKYSPQGQLLWAKKAGANRVNGIAADKAGNVMITGKTTRPALIDTITIPSFNFAGAYEGQLFVARFNTSGSALWVKMAGYFNGGGDFEDSKSIGLDAAGSAYIIGHYRWDSTYFDSVRINGRGWEDLFIAKYDTLGQVQWVTDAGSDGAEFGRAIAVDATGTCYITGSMSSENQPVRFGTILPPHVTQQEDVFVAKLGSNGCSTPGISGFSQLSAAVGDTVSIRGVNFTGTYAVTFHGIAAAYFVVDSATGMRAVVPAGAANGKIGVVTPCGSSQSANNLGILVTYVFTGTDSQWNNPANWNNNQVPVAGDVVDEQLIEYFAQMIWQLIVFNLTRQSPEFALERVIFGIWVME